MTKAPHQTSGIQHRACLSSSCFAPYKGWNNWNNWSGSTTDTLNTYACFIKCEWRAAGGALGAGIWVWKVRYLKNHVTIERMRRLFSKVIEWPNWCVEQTIGNNAVGLSLEEGIGHSVFVFYFVRTVDYTSTDVGFGADLSLPIKTGAAMLVVMLAMQPRTKKRNRMIFLNFGEKYCWNCSAQDFEDNRFQKIVE